jgi:MFS family permease
VREAESSWATRLPFFYGWVIVSVVFLRAFTTAGALWTTGILSVAMHDDLGWSRTIIFAGITLRTLGAAITGVFLGKYMDRTGGARLLATGSSIIAALCLLSIAFVNEPWQFLLIFGVIGGLLGAGPAQLLMGAIVPKWFIRKRGRAMATSTMGTGLAAFLLPPLVALVNESLGWREAWFALGVLAIVLSVLPSLLIRTQPEDMGLLPDGDSERHDAPARGGPPVRVASEYSFTRAEAFRSPTLWLLMLVCIFGMVSPTAFPTNLVPALVEKGFSESTAAISFSLYGLTSFSGRFFWGWLSDRLHIRKTLLIIATYTGVTVPLLLLLPGNLALAAGGIAGLGIGGWVGLNQVLWPAYFGRMNIGAITGTVRPLITLSGATGPLYVAALAEHFDSYTVSILVMALSWWLCGMVLFFVRTPKVPEHARQPEPLASPAG